MNILSGRFLMAAFFLTLLLSCEKEIPELSSEKRLLEFWLDAGSNPQLDSTVTAQIEGNTIMLVLPKNTDVSSLVAMFECSDGATLWMEGMEQLSGTTSNDFSDSLEYTVVAEDGSSAVYRVQISFSSMGIQWTRTAEFPGIERLNAVGFTIGNKFYTGMGIRNMEPFQVYDWYEYDAGNDSWRAIAPFPVEGMEALFSFAIQGKGYVAVDSGGELCDPVCVYAQKKELWEYDPRQDSWSFVFTLEEFQQSVTFFNYVEVFQDRAYLVDSNSASARGVMEFDPVSGSLGKVSPYEAYLIHGTSFMKYGKAYFMTGTIGADFDLRMRSLDLASGTWNTLGDFPGEGRRFASGFALGEYGVVTSGQGKEPIDERTSMYVPVGDTWIYDLKSDVWEQINDTPGEAAYHRTVISNGDLVLLGCGRTRNGLLKEFWTGCMGTLIE
jgi:hypothetical protein